MRRTKSMVDFTPSLQLPSLPTWWDDDHWGTLPPTPKRKDVEKRHSTDLSSVNETDFLDYGHFLNSCSLCKRSIGPGIDTFMYRGEVAFCSEECRDERITEDRRRRKRKKRKKRKKLFLSSLQKANLLPPIEASVSSA